MLPVMTKFLCLFNSFLIIEWKFDKRASLTESVSTMVLSILTNKTMAASCNKSVQTHVDFIILVCNLSNSCCTS